MPLATLVIMRSGTSISSMDVSVISGESSSIMSWSADSFETDPNTSELAALSPDD